MRHKPFVFVLLSMFVIFLSWLGAKSAQAAITSAGYIWYGNTAYFYNYNTQWNNWIGNAQQKYNDQTDLVTYYTTSGGPYRITYYQGNYGADFPFGRAIAYNTFGQPCADFSTGGYTGHCSTYGDYRANRASIYLNDYYIFELSYYAPFIMLHEAGHTFGMGHALCPPHDDSVMRICVSGPVWHSLRPMDIDWINVRY